MEPPKNPSFFHPNHVSSGVQDSVALDLSLQLGLPTRQYPQLNTLEFNGQRMTAPQQLDRPQQSLASSEGSVNQPRETQLSSSTSSELSQFRKLVRKLNYNVECTSDTQSFSSPLRKVKEDVNTVPKSKRPNWQSPEVEAEAEGSSQRILQVNRPLKALWEPSIILNFPEEEFKKAFRMSKATFYTIYYELESVYKKKNAVLPLIFPVYQQVAVCIWRLATGEPFSEISKRFGLEISTCHNFVLEVCSAIWKVLVPKFVQWPSEEKMRDIKRGFEMISGIPDVAGSLYTTHIPIIAPEAGVASHLNKRHTERNQLTSCSFAVQGVVDSQGVFTDICIGLPGFVTDDEILENYTVQGVVDSQGVFTDICIGWPGFMTDDKILENSLLYRRINAGLLKDVWIVGNAGFPLMDWLLVPYTRHSLTRTQHAYNEKVGEVHSIAKEAFMRLKARWKCLQETTEITPQGLPYVVGACCVLHNICEMRDEGMNPELKCELFDDEVVHEIPVRSIIAMQARDQIANELLHSEILDYCSYSQCFQIRTGPAGSTG